MATHLNPLTEPSRALVDIVEDDQPLADGLRLLFDSVGLRSRHFPNGECYIETIESSSADPRDAVPGCLLLDIRLSSVSGLVVFDRLNRLQRETMKPVIFLTGHGEMDTAVDVLTRGAFDFISKPFNSESLLEKVRRAIDKHAATLEQSVFRRQVFERVASLTPKEQLVMGGIVAGKSNREVSEETGNSVRTIELHRARVLEKMGVENAIELSTMLARSGWLDLDKAAGQP